MVAEDGSEVLNSEMTERHISLPKPFTTGDAHEWFQRIEICCRANGWNQAAHVLKLPTLLEGEALAIWLELSEENRKLQLYNDNDYDPHIDNSVIIV